MKRGGLIVSVFGCNPQHLWLDYIWAFFVASSCMRVPTPPTWVCAAAECVHSCSVCWLVCILSFYFHWLVCPSFFFFSLCICVLLLLCVFKWKRAFLRGVVSWQNQKAKYRVRASVVLLNRSNFYWGIIANRGVLLKSPSWDWSQHLQRNLAQNYQFFRENRRSGGGRSYLVAWKFSVLLECCFSSFPAWNWIFNGSLIDSRYCTTVHYVLGAIPAQCSFSCLASLAI